MCKINFYFQNYVSINSKILYKLELKIWYSQFKYLLSILSQ